ncbi:hypothetical protein LCGC14_2017170 [marine sediment metagenome]|uniref:Uncharacterized protein n=1 Tax=marine sediment metagenome TaxID=412755 RepID=A0A0F9HBX9_9ZZZZ
MDDKSGHRGAWVAAAVCCLAWAALPASVGALDVDMDPAPRIPLRVGHSQHFLVHLSGAKAACSGTVSFKDLPAGLAAEPAERKFALKAGESRGLVFKITNGQWGAAATVRPKISVAGDEPVNFPQRLKTEIIRDKKMLDKPPVDGKGLLFYYSCGDGKSYRANYLYADKAAGRDKMWDEGMWEAPGGVFVGYSGTGTVLVHRGQLNTGTAVIGGKWGLQPPGSGRVTLEDRGSTWTCDGGYS